MSIVTHIRREYCLKIVLAVSGLLAHSHALAQAPSATSRGYMYIEGGGVAGESKDVQIARAIAAGPTTITGEARIVGVDSVGEGDRSARIPRRQDSRPPRRILALTFVGPVAHTRT